ncbi:MAG: site-specific tyrosine recombinase XerC, partial [Acidimicrobiia bacterium]
MPRRGERFPRMVPGDQADPFGFPRMVGEFCTWMGTRGMSEKTIDDRHKLLGYLAGWLLDRGVTRPAEVTKPVLDGYQRWLFHYRKPDGRPLTFRSQHTYLVPVRAFFKWAARENRILYNPASELELPRIERRLPKHVLSVEEVEAVLAQPDLGEATGVRDRAMLEVLYSTGIRRSELAHLALFDLDSERHTLLVRQGKGRKDRMVPIGERAVTWVDRYVNDVRPKWAPAPDDGTIFLTVDGSGFSPGTLTPLARRYVDQAKLGKSGSCHLFRHTMATLMLEGGADIRYIQAMLGHADITSTQIYTRVAIGKLKEVYERSHPAAKLGRRTISARARE